jgi:hypothetical protein
VEEMTEVKIILVEEPRGNRPFGWPRRRRKYKIKMAYFRFSLVVKVQVEVFLVVM